jgi:exopolyphosphatase / guanosine-5'-triphosphate,3'-diphosphate pyrophosphatase
MVTQAIKDLVGSGAASPKGGHERRVARLALTLFGQLRSLHGLGREERRWLEAAALLHDIGKLVSRRAHHKASQRIILESRHLPFDRKGRRIVALVARYHRASPPRDSHKHFHDLSAENQHTVTVLAALLRLADGLDRAWGNSLGDLRCEVLSRTVILNVAWASKAAGGPLPACKTALFERVFGKRVVLRCRAARRLVRMPRAA